MRQYVLVRDMGLCQFCKAKGIWMPGNEVDHIIELTRKNKDDPSVAYNPDNCRTLCHTCHNRRHDRKGLGLEEFIKPVGGA